MSLCSIKIESINFARVEIGGLVIYFSYRAPIAFGVSGSSLVVRENEWGPTTGKHLARVPHDKKDRIPGAEFERQLAVAVTTANGPMLNGKRI